MFKGKTFIVITVAVIILIIGYREHVWFFRITTLFLQKIGYSSFQVHTEEIEFLSGNLQLRGNLYTPTFPFGAYPAIVICHGGTKFGRKLALYVIMAKSLAARGYAVLTFDFRGFGESEDPYRFETFSDLDFVQDVSFALNYLSGLRWIDSSALNIVGHSFGAGVAVSAGIRDHRIKKVVSISPGRRTREQFFGENASEPDYPSIRMSRDMKIDPPIPKKIFNPHLQDYVAEAILDFPTHPPILLIDGGQESEEDLVFLRNVYDQMSEPKRYVTINAADHYFGTERNQRGTSEPVPYNETIMAELIETIDNWLR